MTSSSRLAALLTCSAKPELPPKEPYHTHQCGVASNTKLPSSGLRRLLCCAVLT